MMWRKASKASAQVVYVQIPTLPVMHKGLQKNYLSMLSLRFHIFRMRRIGVDMVL